MVCDDGKLALIDYGNAPVLTPQYRQKVAKLIIALNSGSDAEIVEAYKGCGASTKKDNHQFLLYSALCDFD
jgi:predicted unusual protein kinase regulating ubiquinone biosynthesis (AarF/ABC1/UbiB family)